MESLTTDYSDYKRKVIEDNGDYDEAVTHEDIVNRAMRSWL